MTDSLPSGTSPVFSAEKDPALEAFPFLAGGGELGALTRAHNWADSPVGPPQGWPQSLRISVALILSSRFPMLLLWGTNLIQFYNDAFRPSLGNEGKHPLALGQRGADCWPEIWPTIRPLIDQVLAGGEAIWSEDQLIPIYRNGRLDDVYWTFSYSPVLAETGGVGGVLVVCQETTRVVGNEKNRQLLLSSFEQSPVAIAIISGPDLTFQLANPFYAQLVGRLPADLVGRTLLEAIPELEGQGFVELLHGVLNTGIPYLAREQPVVLVRTGQPETLYLNFTYQPQEDAGGRPTAVLVIATDVTEQVTNRRQLERINEDLKNTLFDLNRSNESLRQFAAFASHDLQEPLRKIEAFGSLLDTEYGPQLGEGRDLLGRIRSAARRMSALVRDLLAYARLSAEQDITDWVPLGPVVAQVAVDLELLIQESGATLSIGPLPTVLGNAVQLGQLVQNLLNNALKFRRPDVPLTIQISSRLVKLADLPGYVKPARLADVYHCLDVTDNGIGFSLANQVRIFEIFQRLHGRNQYEGTGIGLAICDRVAANHGGAITARGEVGRGATFSVYIPQTEPLT